MRRTILNYHPQHDCPAIMRRIYRRRSNVRKHVYVWYGMVNVVGCEDNLRRTKKLWFIFSLAIDFFLLILFEVEVADADNISINTFSIILLQLYKYNV